MNGSGWWGQAARAAAVGGCVAGRISYAKVAEFQRRGAIHFHAVIRLDAATDCRCPGCLAPPPEPFTASPPRGRPPAGRPGCPGALPALDDGGPARYARWGEQLDVRNITQRPTRRGSCRPSRWPATSPSTPPRPPRASAPASTAASPPTTSTASTTCRPMWPSSSRRPGSWVPARELDGLRLRAWAHMLGFGGHWSTKSRRYSTTFTVLRRARVAFAKRRRARDGIPLDAWDRPEDDQAVIVVASWIYVGVGLCDRGRALAGPVGRRPCSRTARVGPRGTSHHDRRIAGAGSQGWTS